MFFSFDGIDGCGKSTQTGLFCEYLRETGREVVFCRDPGSTDLGEAVREILLDGEISEISPRSEMLLYMAARAQLVDEVIGPALAAGKVVVSDRFLLANVVYQGHARGLSPPALWQIGQVATDGIAPDLTFVLDLPVEVAAARLGGERDRMESEGQAFHQRLRDGFLVEAKSAPNPIAVIDATASIDKVQQQIRQVATRLLDAEEVSKST
ncbi:MAG: dTMP kinase [Planctomycetes bacterium]|nr:dTMP kinase [Planctomycetota bacterium]